MSPVHIYVSSKKSIKTCPWLAGQEERDCHLIVPILSHEAKLSWEWFRMCFFSNHDRASSAWHALNFSWLVFLCWQHYTRMSLCEHTLLRSVCIFFMRKPFGTLTIFIITRAGIYSDWEMCSHVQYCNIVPQNLKNQMTVTYLHLF